MSIGNFFGNKADWLLGYRHFSAFQIAHKNRQS